MTGEWIAPGEETGATKTPGEQKAKRRLILTAAAEIEPEPVVWAWEDESGGRIPSGSLGLAAGREGTGKSSYGIWLAAKVTTGQLEGALKGRPGAVIYVAVEDSWKFTIVPRLMAAGADLTRVYRAEVVTIEGLTVTLSLPSDNSLLEQAILDKGVVLVVLDPLMSAISDQLDTHVNRQVRQALDPLARMADSTGAVILGIAHFNKSSNSDASSLITASGAFKDVARFIFAFAVDDEDGTQVITQTKNSLGRSDLPSLAYRIISTIVPTRKGDADVGRFVLDGPSDRSVRDILSTHGTAGADQDEAERAQDFLKAVLADGPKRTKEVEEEARERHAITKRTLERGRAKLKVSAGRRPTGEQGKDGKRKPEWWIALPEHEAQLKPPARLPRRRRRNSRAGGVDRQTATPPPPESAGGVGGLTETPGGGQAGDGAPRSAHASGVDRQTAAVPSSRRSGGLAVYGNQAAAGKPGTSSANGKVVPIRKRHRSRRPTRPGEAS